MQKSNTFASSCNKLNGAVTHSFVYADDINDFNTVIILENFSFDNKKCQLGFGFMRLPVIKNEGDIDFEQVNALVDEYMKTESVHYFETAYGYHWKNSETAIRKTLVERYAREDFVLTDKMPTTCDGKHASAAPALQIVSPAPGDVFKWDPSIPAASQQIKFSAVCRVNSCEWKMDEQRLSSRACETWFPLAVGKHHLAVTCGKETQETFFEVLP